MLPHLSLLSLTPIATHAYTEASTNVSWRKRKGEEVQSYTSADQISIYTTLKNVNSGYSLVTKLYKHKPTDSSVRKWETTISTIIENASNMLQHKLQIYTSFRFDYTFPLINIVPCQNSLDKCYVTARAPMTAR